MNDALVAVVGSGLLGYMLSCAFIAGPIMTVRSQRFIRRRVLTTGQPVSGVFAGALLVWCLMKAFVWPLVLTLWLSRGRPEPGTFGRRAPSVPTHAHLA